MKISSKIKDYHLEVCTNAFSQKETVLDLVPHQRRFYFIDKNFFETYQDALTKFIGNDFYLLIEAHEDNKSYLKLADYYKALIQAGLTRSDVLITFGGGILQDISGFIASTLYRGIKWIFFPTTLLAQADSCIGSKTSINFEDVKNLIGTFYPPDLIVVDIQLTSSLNDTDFNSGLGEMIKFHLLSDAKHYALLKKFLGQGNLRQSPYFKDLIASTLEIKKSYFEEDEFDTGRRNLLNYGHCFGHALESASHFGIAHGEAVMVGMGFANLLSLKRGLMSKLKYDEFEAILRTYYPYFDFSRITIDDLIRFMKKDKKRVTADLTMILGRDIGDFGKFDDVKEEEVKAAYQEFIKAYAEVKHV